MSGAGNAASELDRLGKFRTPYTRVDLPDGLHLWVRALSPADALLLSQDDPEVGLKTLALSLCTDEGVRLFDKSNLDDGIALVGEWPASYVNAINSELEALNGNAGIMEDASQD